MHIARDLVAVCLLGYGLAAGVAAQTPPPAPADQSVVVVFDDSGSMGERMRTSDGRVRKIDAAKTALTQVLARLPANTHVGVLALNSQVAGSSWIVPLGPLEDNHWQARIQQISANGGTPLGEFLKLGADELLAARAASPFGNYRLLVVTDGEANDSELVDAYLPDILSRGIVVDAIGVDMQAEHSLARRAHSYRSAADDRSLQQAIQQVFAETSSDDQAAAEDFELLSALPDEFAVEAVKALTQRNNEPIEAQEILLPDGSIAPSPASANLKADDIASVFMGLLCCMCPFVLLLVLVFIIFALRRRRR